MQRTTHRRAFSQPISSRRGRGPNTVHAAGHRSLKSLRGSSSPRHTRSVRPIRATAAYARPAIVLPKVSPEAWKAARPKALALVIAAVLCGIVFAFFNLDSFYVFEPSVIGLENLTKEQVIQAGGITGYNVFFIDGTSVERSLARVPEIKSVHVIPGVPNRLSIQISERQPDVVWERGNDRYWVDAEGFAFKAHGDKPELAIIRDLDQVPVKIGSKIMPDALAAYHALQSAMSEAPSRLEWSSAHGLAFADARGWKVYLGDKDGMTGKVVKFRALAEQLEAQKTQVKFIDLGKGDPYYQ